MSSHMLRFLLRQHLRGRMRLPRVPRQLSPRPIEREYLRDILALLEPLRASATDIIIPRLESIAAHFATRIDDVRMDRTRNEISVLIEGVRLTYMQRITEGADDVAQKTGTQLELFNRRQMNRQFNALVGIDIFGANPRLEQLAAAFTAENVALITSIAERYFAELETGLQRNFRQGRRASEAAEWIQKRFKVNEQRATLIARDQANKFNGELTRQRQEDVGVTSYIWRTSLDERVRPSHRAREGQVYDWDGDNQPPNGEHPGQAVLCRCGAEPNIAALLE